MFNIASNGIISMNKSDTWTTSIFINFGTKLNPVPYDLQPGEFLYFGVMEPNMEFKDALICKKLSRADRTKCDPQDKRDLDHDGYADGYIDIYFKASDTENLLPGRYYYEVKLWRPVTDESLVAKGITEIIDTIIPRTKFTLLN